MAGEDDGAVPQRGTLLRRAHELLESLGQPASENLLVQHLFGANGNAQLWKLLLRQTLKSSSLFEEISEPAEVVSAEVRWALTVWRSTQKMLNEVEFVVLDTETTGLRPGPDRVIEVAGVRVRGGEVVASFQHLINPGRRIPPFIVKFTGITQEMVNEAPSAAEVFPELQRFVDGAILVGHNLGFDINFLSHEARLLGQVFPLDGLDTIPLARRFLPGLKRFKLDLVAEHLKIPTMNRHRAMGDARVTAAIFLRLLELAQQQGILTLGHLRRRLQLPVAWSGDITEASTTRQMEHMRA